MAAVRQNAEGETVRVVRPMNDHGAMTVEVEERNATRHVVEYATPELESTLRALPAGTSIPLVLEPLGVRANAWRAVEIRTPRPA
ncbi:hypothetical protein [Halegenticoccus soli]|uniref:hypothetical protein n=1 Tax=Halegenticoccus soli TaxID=1985678 RepID=UPI000C6EB871|nr:hypothetical protein [Halegenticoccus soli]